MTDIAGSDKVNLVSEQMHKIVTIRNITAGCVYVLGGLGATFSTLSAQASLEENAKIFSWSAMACAVGVILCKGIETCLIGPQEAQTDRDTHELLQMASPLARTFKERSERSRI
jgi:hypothetical protein